MRVETTDKRDIATRTRERINQLRDRQKELRHDLHMVEEESRYLHTGLQFAYDNGLLERPETTD